MGSGRGCSTSYSSPTAGCWKVWSIQAVFGWGSWRFRSWKWWELRAKMICYKLKYVGGHWGTELKHFRVQLVRNCPKLLEWTDDLKSEYTNKFLHLNTTLDTLYNRLNGIGPFTWNCGKCAKSCVTTSIRDSPNILINRTTCISSWLDHPFLRSCIYFGFEHFAPVGLYSIN